MGKISTYEQGQLASSVVGTPGVDTTMSSALAGVSNVFTGIGSEIVRTARQNQVEIFRLQREQRAIEKAQQEIATKSRLAAEEADTRFVISQQLEQIKNENVMTPEKIPEQARALFSREITARKSNFADIGEAQQFETAMTSEFSRTFDTLAASANAQRTLMTKNNMETAMDKLSRTSATYDQSSQFEPAWGKFVQDNQTLLELSFGPKWQNTVNTYKKESFENMVAGRVMKGRYAEAEQLLKTYNTDEFMGADEKTAMLGRIKAGIKTEQQIAALEATRTGYSTFFETKSDPTASPDDFRKLAADLDQQGASQGVVNATAAEAVRRENLQRGAVRRESLETQKRVLTTAQQKAKTTYATLEATINSGKLQKDQIVPQTLKAINATMRDLAELRIASEASGIPPEQNATYVMLQGRLDALYNNVIGKASTRELTAKGRAGQVVQALRSQTQLLKSVDTSLRTLNIPALYDQTAGFNFPTATGQEITQRRITITNAEREIFNTLIQNPKKKFTDVEIQLILRRAATAAQGSKAPR